VTRITTTPTDPVEARLQLEEGHTITVTKLVAGELKAWYRDHDSKAKIHVVIDPALESFMRVVYLENYQTHAFRCLPGEHQFRFVGDSFRKCRLCKFTTGSP
jgi:rRNA-processing protein FCF1